MTDQPSERGCLVALLASALIWSLFLTLCWFVANMEGAE